MARYQSGNMVAFVNKFQRCGRVVQVDGEKGYKVDTGYDIIYAYESQLVLISATAPIRPLDVIKKIEEASDRLPEYTPAFRDNLLSFLNGGSQMAKTFASYIKNVPTNIVRECIKNIASSPAKIDIDSNINIEINCSIKNLINIDKLFNINLFNYDL